MDHNLPLWKQGQPSSPPKPHQQDRNPPLWKQVVGTGPPPQPIPVIADEIVAHEIPQLRQQELHTGTRPCSQPKVRQGQAPYRVGDREFYQHVPQPPPYEVDLDLYLPQAPQLQHQPQPQPTSSQQEPQYDLQLPMWKQHIGLPPQPSSPPKSHQQDCKLPLWKQVVGTGPPPQPIPVIADEIVAHEIPQLRQQELHTATGPCSQPKVRQGQAPYRVGDREFFRHVPQPPPYEVDLDLYLPEAPQPQHQPQPQHTSSQQEPQYDLQLPMWKQHIGLPPQPSSPPNPHQQDRKLPLWKQDVGTGPPPQPIPVIAGETVTYEFGELQPWMPQQQELQDPKQLPVWKQDVGTRPPPQLCPTSPTSADEISNLQPWMTRSYIETSQPKSQPQQRPVKPQYAMRLPMKKQHTGTGPCPQPKRRKMMLEGSERHHLEAFPRKEDKSD